MSVVTTKSYVKFENKGYWLIDTRISLDSVVYAFKEGLLPESIAQSYPLLDLEKVYGAIAFYLANRADIDAYLSSEEQAFNAMPQPLASDAPSLYKKLVAAKTSLQQGQ
ncbi:DUF433 domain-containing protein [cf. Phormidesmis sp. LEGE 11477]|uniref:DUF433 domain-containing protein n=1 Tax=cf. Phormidesmis sp. LEGE 11477 TaxID=1828680 RepID=UPI00187EA28C|nr:DUF433 domain-containing protein [cf. Phormidesmis sp. LEGE 11477]MBE9064449.1 DUF433 domain-containing protein [cf. Phormidesmis sp. LEGE 11477]